MLRKCSRWVVWSLVAGLALLVVPHGRASNLDMHGTIYYDVHGLLVDYGAAYVENYDPWYYTSGTLALQLWATSRPYYGGLLTGYKLAEEDIGRLEGGYYLYDIDVTDYFSAPPAGCYYMVMVLAEWTGYAYETADYHTFSGTECFGSLSVPALLSPAGVVSSTLRPVFLWTEVPLASWYNVVILRNGSTYSSVWVDGLSWIPSWNLEPGSYTWYVQPWSTLLGFGPWSLGLSFTIPSCAPQASSPQSPSGQLSTSRPTLRWSSVSGATWYHLWVGRNGTAYLDQWLQSTSWTPSSDLPAGSYSFYIQTWGPCGFGPWSGAQAFSIPSKVPGAITQTAPSGAQTETTLTYRWQKDANATWYRLWSGRNGVTFHDKWYEMSGTGEASVTLAGHPAGDLTWWIVGWGPDGFGPWAGPKAFSTPSADPEKPVPISPVGANSGTRPTFKWNAATRAEWYHVWVVSVGRMDKYVWDGWTTATTLPLPSNVTLGAGGHRWWVSSWNNATQREIWSGPVDFSSP